MGEEEDHGEEESVKKKKREESLYQISVMVSLPAVRSGNGLIDWLLHSAYSWFPLQLHTVVLSVCLLSFSPPLFFLVLPHSFFAG